MRLPLEGTNKQRIVFFLAVDVVLIILSVVLAFLLRFDLEIPQAYFSGVLPSTVILILIFTLLAFNYYQLYHFVWAYVSVGELVSLLKAVFFGFLFSGAAILALRDQHFLQGFPRSVLIITYFLIFIFCGSARLAKRVSLQLINKRMGDKEKTLIAGAGGAAAQILRNIILSKDSPYLPVGLVDDAPYKEGILIQGFKVLGKISDIPKIVKEKNVKNLIIAMPSASGQVIKNAVEKGREAGLSKITITPSIKEIIGGRVSIRDLRSVEITDLLGREPVNLDTKAIENFVKGKKVMITGGAGSIGSELCRQLSKFFPAKLSILDQDETGVFNIENELKNKFPNAKIVSFVADIRDSKKIDGIFAEFNPDIVFHAAAYKHVPLMEKHPDEAVKNNILGTEIVGKAAIKHKTGKFIYVSTDKAINPTSVMGATKRVGEMICQNLNQKNSTKFISVRFGNVLDSRGSVIPIFREQIKKGGPVEVTHPEMKRFFMTIPEACLLVTQAAQMGLGGEVFVLDMGKLVKIWELAKEMIKLSGFEPDKDIPIVFTKPRPGEKLFEDILSAEEGTVATSHQKIFMAKLSPVDEKSLENNLGKLRELSEKSEKIQIVELLKSIVPFYKPVDKNAALDKGSKI